MGAEREWLIYAEWRKREQKKKEKLWHKEKESGNKGA